MSFKHNSLKNLFLDESIANALYQLVLEREQLDEPKFTSKVLTKLWDRKEVDTDHDVNDVYATIEFGDWDIGIEADRRVLVYTSDSKDFHKKFGEYHTEGDVTFCIEDDPMEVVITQDLGPEELTLYVDVIPKLGEEYPHVLRDMKRKIPEQDDENKYVLLVDECSVQSCVWEDLVEIFDQHDITLVSFKELMQ